MELNELEEFPHLLEQVIEKMDGLTFCRFLQTNKYINNFIESRSRPWGIQFGNLAACILYENLERIISWEVENHGYLAVEARNSLRADIRNFAFNDIRIGVVTRESYETLIRPDLEKMVNRCVRLEFFYENNDQNIVEGVVSLVHPQKISFWTHYFEETNPAFANIPHVEIGSGDMPELQTIFEIGKRRKSLTFRIISNWINPVPIKMFLKEWSAGRSTGVLEEIKFTNEAFPIKQRKVSAAEKFLILDGIFSNKIRQNVFEVSGKDKNAKTKKAAVEFADYSVTVQML